MLEPLSCMQLCIRLWCEEYFPKQGLHWWSSHGLGLVPWISRTLWSRSAAARNDAEFPPSVPIGNLEFPKKQDMQIHRMHIHSAQNVYRVLISTKNKRSTNTFSGHFKSCSHGTKQYWTNKNVYIYACFPWWPLPLSVLGGASVNSMRATTSELTPSWL